MARCPFYRRRNVHPGHVHFGGIYLITLFIFPSILRYRTIYFSTSLVNKEIKVQDLKIETLVETSLQNYTLLVHYSITFGKTKDCLRSSSSFTQMT